MDFFNNLGIQMNLNWLLLDNINLVKPIIGVVDSQWDFSKTLYDSFEIEGDEITDDVVDKLQKYSGNDIQEIHKILTKGKYPFKRNLSVAVVDDYAEPIHFGLKVSQIDYDFLQKCVDKYYSYQFSSSLEKTFCGFLLYLFYIRIHPHQDGNGRTGRYLFLENIKLFGTENYFPLSTIMKLHGISMNPIYKVIDITEEHADKSVYYTFNFSDKIVKQIIHILYVTLLYKHLMIKDNKLVIELNENDNFKSIICYGKVKWNNKTVSKDSKLYTMLRNQVSIILTKLKPYLDMKLHKEMLNKLLS